MTGLGDPLGREFQDGQEICRQGEPGDRMFVLQSGRAVVMHEEDGVNVEVGRLESGDVFGEMSLFDRQPRSATVKAEGSAFVLTLDRVAFLRRVHEDPSLAFRILEKMSSRIRDLDGQVARLRGAAPTMEGSARA